MPAQAQRTSGAVGLGGQAGDPSGVTLKIYNAGTPSYDFFGAWSSVDDFFLLNAHALFEEPIRAENIDQPLEWFIGPGGFIGTFRTGGPFDGEAVIGISGAVGLQMESPITSSSTSRPRLALRSFLGRRATSAAALGSATTSNRTGTPGSEAGRGRTVLFLPPAPPLLPDAPGRWEKRACRS